MKQTRIVTLLCLIASIAHAQQNMRGSDTLALYTRGLITDLGLGSQLNYLGGGSGLGIADAIGITDGYGPTGAQATLLTGAQNCGCNCPRLAANGFFAVTADYCTSCTATCP